MKGTKGSTLLGIPQVLTRLDVDRGTLWRWRKAGVFPEGIKPRGSSKGRVYFRIEDILSFEKGNYQPKKDVQNA